MKKYIPFILIFGVALLISGEVFSQVAETGSDNSKLFNEGGYVRGITAARAIGLVELALGIASIVIGLGARKRAKSGIGNKGQKGARVALLLGSIAIVISVIHLSITTGAVFGSGC